MEKSSMCFVIIGIAILILLGLFAVTRETFSTSGLAISDDYCRKLNDVYVDPQNKNPAFRKNAAMRICGQQRRHMVDDKFGNYFTMNGMLI